MKRVAIAGNPNSGKSTLFNALTGSRAHVGNYPGVTVERKEGTVKLASGHAVTLIDLPGCYSLTARSAEEEVAHQVLTGARGEPTDAVICVVDATQLARGLYLVLQLKGLGIIISEMSYGALPVSMAVWISVTVLVVYVVSCSCSRSW